MPLDRSRSDPSPDQPASTLLALRRRLQRAGRAVRRRLLAHRRPLAAACVGTAVLAGLQAVRPPSAATVPVVVAAGDLPAGRVLASTDLSVARYPPPERPDAALGDPAPLVGHELAAPVGAGEPLSEARLVGPALADAVPGATALPVRLPDAGAVALLAPGDRVDLVAVAGRDQEASVVARDVRVLAVPSGAAGGQGGAGSSYDAGALVVVAAPEEVVPLVARAAAQGFLTFTWAS